MPSFATSDKTEGFVIDSLPGAYGDFFGSIILSSVFKTIIKRSETLSLRISPIMVNETKCLLKCLLKSIRN